MQRDKNVRTGERYKGIDGHELGLVRTSSGAGSGSGGGGATIATGAGVAGNIGGKGLRGANGESNNDHERPDDYGRLFNSHLSVFNALTNPDLELSPNLNNELKKFPSNSSEFNKFYIDESWQNIGNDSIMRTLNQSPFAQSIIRPSSLLSITTDDDQEGQDGQNGHDLHHHGTSKETPVMVDSMVFETDEEDDFKDNTFIMPKMSVSSSNEPLKFGKLKICLISSFSKLELNHIFKDFNNNKNLEIFNANIKNFNFKNSSKVTNANLIFIINDGSNKLIDFLKKIFDDKYPPNNKNNSNNHQKFTIINMITVNYFGNLFELINFTKPYQIWKISSLNSEKLTCDINNFVNSELNFQNSNESSFENSMYSSLISSSNKNYKLLEKKFKSELIINSNNIDPLQLKKFQIFNNILNKTFSTSVEPLKINDKINDCNKNNDDLSDNESFNGLYILASFTIGISLGYTIANGLAKFFTIYVTKDLINPLEDINICESDSEVLNLNYFNLDFKHSIHQLKLGVLEILDSNIFDDFSKFFFNFLNNLKLTSSFLIDYAYGGFEKLSAII